MNRHTKHYFRAAFLIVGAVLLFFLARAFLVPKSFKKHGFYRADNVKEQMQKPVRFGPLNACAQCHEDVWATHQNGAHASVQCQNCHDALSVHYSAEKDDLVGEMPKDRSAKTCLRCHLKLSARPKDFPQIDVEAHLSGAKDAHKQDVCLDCHTPHNPKK